MDDKEKRIRHALAQSLGDLAESIIRRDPPYGDIPIQQEVMGFTYKKYLQYYDEIDISLRQRILDMLIATARWKIKSMLIKDSYRFDFIYPEHVEIARRFEEWITNKEGQTPNIIVSLPKSIPKSINLNIIIKRIMTLRMPLFNYDKSLCNPGQVCFSTSLLNNKVGIIVDKGIKRYFIDLMFCIHWPRSYFDIASFFAGSQSRFKYNSSEDLIAALNKALDLVDVLFPTFADRVKDTLDKCKDDWSQAD